MILTPVVVSGEWRFGSGVCEQDPHPHLRGIPNLLSRIVPQFPARRVSENQHYFVSKLPAACLVKTRALRGFPPVAALLRNTC